VLSRVVIEAALGQITKQKDRERHANASGGLATVAWIPSGLVWAQSDNAQAGTAAPDQLQEVVVTAERREANVQTTPIAVTAVSGDQLQELHLNTISNLQTTVPSFQSQDAGGMFNSINIRGIGNSAITPVISTGIAVLRDGLLMSETIGEDVPLFDYSDTKLDGAVNLPVSDTFAARIAFNAENRRSYYNDVYALSLAPGPSGPLADPAHMNTRDGRLSLLWKPTDNFQALMKGEYNYIETGGPGGQPNPYIYNSLFSNNGPGSQELCPTPGTVTHSQFWYPGEKPFVTNSDLASAVYNELETRIGLELRYTLPDGIVLRSMTGFTHIDIKHIDDDDETSVNSGITYHEIGPDDNYYSEELNLISPTTGKLNWLAGAFTYYRITPVFLNDYSFPPPYAQFETPSTVVTIANDSIERLGGVFGQVNWQFTPTVQLQAGARDNWDNNFSYGNPPGLDGV